MDVSMITGAYTGLKFAKDALSAALAYKIDNETRAQISTALEKLGTAQDTLFELREELSRLQMENEQIRQELKSRDSWDVQKLGYTLQQTPGGAVVYASVQPPRHYACPSCFGGQRIQILLDRRVMSGIFDCPGCKTTFPVNLQQR